MNPRDQFPRSECACAGCVACCKAMPGMLIPGDVERIESVQPELWPRQYLVASEGALVVYQGQPMRIPTVVPAQKPDGSCVFLDDQDRCTIHAVAPYGCSHFDTHQSRSGRDGGDARSCAGLQAIVQDTSGNYVRLWKYLVEQGCTAPPLQERRARLERLLLEVQDDATRDIG
jgi:Fe-S-cluster containining protein